MKRILGLSVLLISPISQSEEYYGVDFPSGEISFADRVVSYTEGGNVTSPYNSPSNVIGVPDYVSGGSPEYLSLGDEGELVVQFTNNSLTTSGDDVDDLWVFEIGSELEPTAVYISEAGNDWIYVGETTGGVGGIDIDLYTGSGVELGVKYSYVKIVDLPPIQSASPWAGADIDAIGVISSVDGVCGEVDYLPATYDSVSGKINIPYIVSEGNCYELELDTDGQVSLELIETYTTSTVIKK